MTNVLLKLKTRKAVVKGERPPDYTVLKDKVAADFGQRVLQQTFVASKWLEAAVGFCGWEAHLSAPDFVTRYWKFPYTSVPIFRTSRR